MDKLTCALMRNTRRCPLNLEDDDLLGQADNPIGKPNQSDDVTADYTQETFDPSLDKTDPLGIFGPVVTRESGVV